MKKKRKVFYAHGQSLIEAIVATGVVVVLATGLIAVTISQLRVGQMSKNRMQGLQYAKEGMEVVRILKDTGWDKIPTTSKKYCLPKNAADLGVEKSACPYDIDNFFSRTIEFAHEDPQCSASNSCMKVTVTVGWKETKDRSVVLTSYMTNWRTKQ